MLETVALCTVLFDLSGIWISYLPFPMQDQVYAQIGLDPWSEDVQIAMTDALGVAADGDGARAWVALHAAERAYFALSPDQVVSEVLACAEAFPFTGGDVKD